MLILWLAQIGTNRKAHHDISIKLSTLEDKFNVIPIILSGIAGIICFIGLYKFTTLTQDILKIIAGIIAIISGVITSILSWMKFGENAQKHKTISSEYSDLSSLIQATVVDKNRPDISSFMKLVIDRINIIQRFGPQLLINHASIADLPNYMLVKNAGQNVLDEGDLGLYYSTEEKKEENINDIQLEELIISDTEN